MSKIGKRPITLPKEVTLTTTATKANLKGPLGNIDVLIPKGVSIKQENDLISIIVKDTSSKRATMPQGSLYSLVNSAIIGVTKGFSKILKIEGVGFKASLKGKNLALALGYTHPVELAIPEGIKIEIPVATEIRVSGSSKERVGQFAAEIRGWKEPEPYNGKGIAYSTEKIVRKVGKTAKGTKK